MKTQIWLRCFHKHRSIIPRLFLPNDKILDWSKFKAFIDDKINVTEKLKFVLGRMENIEGKGENAGLPVFSPFSRNNVFKCVQRVFKNNQFQLLKICFME